LKSTPKQLEIYDSTHENDHPPGENCFALSFPSISIAPMRPAATLKDKVAMCKVTPALRMAEAFPAEVGGSQWVDITHWNYNIIIYRYLIWDMSS
jgi:hypothetical protein